MNLTKFDKPIIDVLGNTIEFLLSVIGGIALLVIILGGIFYIFAGANPEAQNKAKGTVTKAIIGLMFVLVSYAIVDKISYVSTDIQISIVSATVVPTSGVPPATFTIKATVTSDVGVDAATTRASIQNPNENEVDNILLKDDGNAPDLIAGDNIYSGEWKSAVVGSYFIDVTACNTDGVCKEIENI
ncbi:MAG: hypothetical protein KAQ87_05490 [Candidatus Pacebacteria bacterium]|nr:hypothetical protein [Candidatus Paceibacterota bacterium]